MNAAKTLNVLHKQIVQYVKGIYSYDQLKIEIDSRPCTYKLYISRERGCSIKPFLFCTHFFFYSVSIVHIYIYILILFCMWFFFATNRIQGVQKDGSSFTPPPTHTLVFWGIFLNQSSNLLKSGPWNQNKPKFHWKASWEKTWCIVKVFGNLAHQLAIFCSYV